MNKVKQTLNSIDRANESVEDAKFNVQNTMFDVNSKIVTLEQQVESAYMENEYIQESVLAGTLIGGGILALIGGIVAAVKKFMGKSSSGDKSEETSKKASAGDQLAVVKMTGVSDDAIQKSIKELQDAINGLDLGDKEIPGTFVDAEGTKIQEDLNAIYAGLEELIDLQNKINEAEDEAAQTKLISSMTDKVKEISEKIKAIDGSKLKNQTAIPVPEAIASVQAAYAFKKGFSDQKKLDEIEKQINAAKSAKLKTDETGTSEDVKQAMESLKKTMATRHANLVSRLTDTTNDVDTIIAATRDAIFAAANDVKKQQPQQQQQQNTDEYPVLAKYNITKEQVLDDMKSDGASQAFTKGLPNRLSGKKIEESDLDELVTAYSDIATKNNITTDTMKSVADYKNDASFMANVETGNPQPQQQQDQDKSDEYVTSNQVIQAAYNMVTRNKTLTRDICIQVINDLMKYDWVNPVTSIKSLISSGNIKGILSNCNAILESLTRVEYLNLVDSDQTINSNYEIICNGIINNFMKPIIEYLNSLGNDLTNASISKPVFEKIKQNFERYKERLKQRGINPQRHDAEIDIPDMDNIMAPLSKITKMISHKKNVDESTIKNWVDSMVQKLSVSDKKVPPSDVVTKMDNVASNLEAFVNVVITDTSTNEIKESTNNLVSGLVTVCQNVSNAVIDNNIKANMNSLTQRFQKITNDINSKQPKPQQQQPKLPQDVIDSFKARLNTLIKLKMLDTKYAEELKKDAANIDLLINKISELETDPSHFIANTEESEFSAGVTKACAELWGLTEKDKLINDLCTKLKMKRESYDDWANNIKRYSSLEEYLTKHIVEHMKNGGYPFLKNDEAKFQRYIDTMIKPISDIEGIPSDGNIKTAKEYIDLANGTTGPESTGVDKDQQITDLCAKYFGNERKKYDVWVSLLTNAGTVDDCLTKNFCIRSDAKTLVPNVRAMQIYIELCMDIAKIEGFPAGNIKTAQVYFDLINGNGSKKDLDTLKNDIASQIFMFATADKFSDRPELKQRLTSLAEVNALVNDICNDLGNDTAKIEELNNKAGTPDFINAIKTARDKKWPLVNTPNQQLTEADIQKLFANYNLDTTNTPGIINNAKVFADAINSQDPAQINPLINSITNAINSLNTIDELDKAEPTLTNYANFIFELIDNNLPDSIKSQVGQIPNVKDTFDKKRSSINGNPKQTNSSLSQDQVTTAINDFMTSPSFSAEVTMLRNYGWDDTKINDALTEEFNKSVDDVRNDILNIFLTDGREAEIGLYRYVLSIMDKPAYDNLTEYMQQIAHIYVTGNNTMYFMNTFKNEDGNHKGRSYKFIMDELNKDPAEIQSEIETARKNGQRDLFNVLSSIASKKGMKIVGYSKDDEINDFIKSNGLEQDNMDPYTANKAEVEQSIRKALELLNHLKDGDPKRYQAFKDVIHKIYERVEKLKVKNPFTSGIEVFTDIIYSSSLRDAQIKSTINKSIGSDVLKTILQANDNIKSYFQQYRNSSGPILEYHISEEELQKLIDSRKHVFLNEQKEIVSNGSSEVYYEAFIYDNGYIEIL